ncbi:MAG TPA: hypothetical protein VFG10_00330 [Saprospiraceae bacterium]|nr:hypothetical protein [Saprospiraceae bacterium]
MPQAITTFHFKMKTNLLKLTQCMFTALLVTISLSAFSQKTITWKGGAPGMKNEWHCAQNWSTSSVPDEFSDVIIPDVSTTSFSFPVLRSGTVEVNSLAIYTNGSLTISKDAVVVVHRNAEGNCENNLYGEGQILFHTETAINSKKMIAAGIK